MNFRRYLPTHSSRHFLILLCMLGAPAWGIAEEQGSDRLLHGVAYGLDRRLDHLRRSLYRRHRGNLACQSHGTLAEVCQLRAAK